MQEFSSISVSTYDPDALVGQLNDKSSDGWNVVAIVPTGSTITAYLSRDGDPGDQTATNETDVASAIIPEPAPEPAQPVAAEPAEPSPFTPSLPGAATAEPTPEPAPEPTPEPAPEPTPEPAPEPAAQATQPTSSAAPAGWYADPAGRFELRYWDGGTWTEHVSRSGQQYTDPPVA